MGAHDLIECPLCDWTIERPTPTIPSTALGQALGTGVGGLAAMWAHMDADDLERKLDTHLRSHPPTDWLPALMEARARATRAEVTS